MIERAWKDEVQGVAGNRPILFVAEGLLQYLQGPQVERLVTTLAGTFPGSEAILEVISPLAAAISEMAAVTPRTVGVRAHCGISASCHDLERWSATHPGRERAVLRSPLVALAMASAFPPAPPDTETDANRSPAVRELPDSS